MGLPFHYDELYRVFLHTMSEEEASKMAHDALLEPRADEPTKRGKRGLAYRSAPNVTLTEDTLVLLSLESEDLDRRVREYRLAFRGGTESAEEAAEWQRRRAELEAWAKAGYPIDKE